MDQDTRMKKAVTEQFGRNAEKYVLSESHAQGDDLKLLLEWLSPGKDWIALDIATGGGHVAKALAPHVDLVLSTDLTEQMLYAARKHLKEEGLRNIQYILADAESLPFLNDSFDLVTCRIAAHHFPHPKKFISEATRVLRPGGHLLLIDNVAPDDESLAEYMNTFEKLRDESHVRCGSVKEWESWLVESGLNLIKTRTRKKAFDFSTWIGRMAKSQEQIDLVEQYILAGLPSAHQYFNIQSKNGHIESLQIDEWMAHWLKPL